MVDVVRDPIVRVALLPTHVSILRLSWETQRRLPEHVRGAIAFAVDEALAGREWRDAFGLVTIAAPRSVVERFRNSVQANIIPPDDVEMIGAVIRAVEGPAEVKASAEEVSRAPVEGGPPTGDAGQIPGVETP